ncbi:MAG: hypothetical protein U1D26_00395 [Patescibacteria group bacterium]|nr:hypothetical protein [Patescibacteria group bacterium]
MELSESPVGTAVILKVREAIKESGCCRIAVLGWIGKQHHDLVTREMERKKVVIFYDHESPPAVLGDSIGYILYTRLVDHSVIQRFKKVIPICPFALSPRQIKRILRACMDLLIPLSCVAPCAVTTTVMLETKPPLADIELAERAVEQIKEYQRTHNKT